MSIQDNGGPAFPALITLEHNELQGKDYVNFDHAGMTLRDYFAAKAMGLFLSKAEWWYEPQSCANKAYEYADAMLEERAK